MKLVEATWLVYLGFWLRAALALASLFPCKEIQKSLRHDIHINRQELEKLFPRERRAS